ncbi:divergent polysaccharide deacetylase family protein [Actibacterium ureilyticum]|uniref:divergent polysaccharide deacetylase family protein n=1 Tax=Actibacterium ureilyticum TaxID=1590614 RepID=UPI000BAB0EEE|nr:divergent polysaccharide deacetylase family protein [Actibacterium ureilyticum]
MGRGILGGAVLGLVVALFGAGILSLLAPPPKRAMLPPEPAITAEIPAPEPAAPAPEVTAPTDPAPVVAEPAAPETVAPDPAAPPVVETVELPQTTAPEGGDAAQLPEDHARIVVAPEASPPEQPTAPADPEMAETAPAALPQPVLQPEAPRAPEQPPAQDMVIAGLPPAPDGPAGPPPAGVDRPRAETLPEVPPTATPLPVPAPDLPAAPAVPAPAAPSVPVVEPLPDPAQPATPLPRLARPGSEPSPIGDGVDPSPATPRVTDPVPAPEPQPAPEIATDPAPQPRVLRPGTDPQPAPEAEPAPLPRVVRPGTDPTPEPEPAPEAPVAEAEGEDRATGALRVAVPGRQISVPKVRVNRLPTIGGEGPAPAAPGSLPGGTGADTAPDDGRALTRNAVPFDPVDGKPLFSVILIDAPGTRLSPEALRELAFPVTFVVDAAQKDASIAARDYRQAGHEVIMMAGGLPDGATAQDVEVSLTTYLNRVPNAVAVMDPGIAGGQTNRAMLRQMVAIAGESGHGLVSFERGLNAAQQVATSQGVPNAMVFRVLDAKGEDAGTIHRYLDRAAFKAGQQGQVAVLGHTRPDTLSALLTWALAGKGGEMNLAPISALLTR